MSEIEKMMQNAKVKPVCDGLDCFTCAAKCNNGKYPEFTAEKQLSLIKWLAVKGDFDSSIDIAKNTFDYWTIYFQGARWTAEGFEESLVGLINNLWQDLTDQERTEIADILRG